MNRFLAVPLLMIVAILSTAPQNLPDVQQRIRQSVESRNYSAAITELQKLQIDDPKTFAVNNYDYLLARMAESDAQLAVAMSNYQAVVNRHSELDAWALKHLSQIARSTGNLMLERLYLNELQYSTGDTFLANGAALRLARNSFERGNYAETIRILTTGGQFHAGDTSRKTGKEAAIRENQALLGEAYLRLGETHRARDIFATLISTMPNSAQPDDVAMKAAKSLDALDAGGENAGKKVANLSETEQFQRANIYQFNRDFTDAKLHFETLIGNFPAGANSAEAAFQIGRGFAQQSDYVHALEWFERVLERYPGSTAAKDALLQAASAYARVGKHKEAIKRYQSFIDKYPADDKLDRAYLNIVDILRDQGDDIDALKWCAKTEATFKGKVPEAVAIFAEARTYIARGEWQAAPDALDRLKNSADLGGTAIPGGTSIAEVTFLKGFVLEQLKRYSDAIETYLSIPDGRGEYYGWRATERLRSLSNDETSRSFLVQKIGMFAGDLKAKEADTRRLSAQGILRLSDSPDLREKALGVLKAAIKTLPKYQGVPAFKLAAAKTTRQPGQIITPAHQSVADSLLFLGLYDEATPELEAADGEVLTAAGDKAYTLATYYTRGDRADRGMAFIEPVWRKLAVDYPVELIPRDQLELLYPAPYTDILLRLAPARGVDPRLLLAIMRQESRFQPDAKSYAAARGLMQFISTTSTHVADELGRNAFDQDDLYYPPTAILFGSQYLADLFKSFPNQPDAVVASYNGGDDNMKRWLARSRSNLPERYVPEILYAQSKDYVYKVMSNYRMYRYMYDENLHLK